ncbi:MAG: carboxypeptidase regulatory-like domain-containing protein [Planctomycetes bacterium]|nr:carboxypeptidase regulatory-like domain-containing protein [Planctomycetota bacterium]
MSRRLLLARDTIVADLVIELYPPASVRGRVVDAQGRPVAGAIVFASGAGPNFAATLADCEEQRAGGENADTLWGLYSVASGADGRFAIGGLHPQLDWALGLLAKGHVPTAGGAVTLDAGRELDVGGLTLPPK